MPLRQYQLVGFVLRFRGRNPCVPAWWGSLTGRIHGFQRLPDDVYLILEEIADEEVRNGTPKIRILLHELTEAESIVVFANEPPHSVNALVEDRRPPSELRLGKVAFLE